MTGDAPTKLPLGKRHCANPQCTALVDYRHKVCKVCQTAQVRPVAQAGIDPLVADAGAKVIVHPSAKATLVVEPYVVMRDFRQLLGEVVGEFKAGMTITDHSMIQHLLADGSPIAPLSQAAGMACCPHCKTVFQVPVKAAEKKRVG